MRTFQRTDVFVNETYEYAFSAVPPAKKKSTGSLLLIMAGVAFSTTGLTLGAGIGSSMEFPKAIAACLIGNTFLFLFTLFWGLLGYKTGYTSVFLVKKIVGEKAGLVFAILVTVTMIVWIGLNGDMLSKMLVSIYPRWQIPGPVTVLLAVALCVSCAISGWKGLEMLAKIAVPVVMLLTIYNISYIFHMKDGASFFFQYQPENNMEFIPAIVTIIGNFFLAAVTSPNLCRFAKNVRAVVVCTLTYALVLSVSNFGGILIVQATQANNLNYGIYILGMLGQNFVWVLLCTYTTQSVNMYAGSLAVQGIVRGTAMGGNVSHSTSVLMIGGLSAIVGITGIASKMTDFIGVMLMMAVPFAVLVVVEVFMRKGRREPDEKIPLAAWLAGVAFGVVVGSFAGAEPAALQIPFTALVYAVLRGREKRFTE